MIVMPRFRFLRRLRDERGSYALELSIGMPLVAAALALTVDLAVYSHQLVSLTQTAEASAQSQSLSGGAYNSQVAAQVQADLVGKGLNPGQVTVSAPTGQAPLGSQTSTALTTTFSAPLLASLFPSPPQMAVQAAAKVLQSPVAGQPVTLSPVSQQAGPSLPGRWTNGPGNWMQPNQGGGFGGGGGGFLSRLMSGVSGDVGDAWGQVRQWLGMGG
ncbi:MAG: hypothetical protein M0031_09455 [Thermaerobacter sp.]|nr:hypothetical protein [Thermaerobacter sp.]